MDDEPTDSTGAVNDLLAHLGAWSADFRVDEAARARTRERWLRQQATEEATFTGLLVDLAERRAAIVLRTTSGSAHHGVVTAVGADFVALRAPDGATRLVTLRVVTAVEGADGMTLRELSGSRAEPADARLVDVLAQVAADRRRVLLVAESETFAGEVDAVGADVVRVRRGGSPVYVRLVSITEVALLE